MRLLSLPKSAGAALLAWSEQVRVALQEVDQRVNQIETRSESPTPPAQAGGVYPGSFYELAKAKTIPAHAVCRAHYVNCTTAADLTLPNARRAAWLIVQNCGTQLITIKNQAGTTLITLSSSEQCKLKVWSDSSGVLDWQVSPNKWNVSSGTYTFAGVTVSAIPSGRVIFSGTGGILTHDANFTYNSSTDQLALAATGASAGILIGGDVQIYRSAADTCLIPDRLTISPPTNTQTAADVYGILVSHTANPASATAVRTFGLAFTATASGNQNYTNSTAGITGLEGAVQHTGTGTITRAIAALFFGQSASTGTLTDMTHCYALGWDVSSGATITTWNGFRADFPRSASPGGTIGTAYGFVTHPRVFSAGTMTTMIGYGVFPLGNMNAHTANGQVRLGIDIGAMPDPGAFTGTTTAAIRIQGTAGSRDGILFSNVRLFRGASLILHTDGGLKSIHDTNGLGYGTGAGGTVTQATSKATGVTLNKVCGQITMNNAALNAATSVSFTLTNSAIAATDTVIVNIASAATADSYIVTVTAVAAGSCRIQVYNFSGSNLSEALVLNFSVIKAVTS